MGNSFALRKGLCSKVVGSGPLMVSEKEAAQLCPEGGRVRQGRAGDSPAGGWQEQRAGSGPGACA